MLETVGLDPVEERLYRFLVTAAEAGVVDLAAELDLDVGAVETVLSSMEARGLVRTASAETAAPAERRFTAVSPDIVLGARLLRQQQSLDWARRTVEQLSEEYRGNARRRDAGLLVEVLPNRIALREQLEHLQENAREEVLCFCRGSAIVMHSTENDAELDALRRGVVYRVVYERDLLEEPGMQANVAYGVKLGERARALPRLPVRLMVVDREIGLLPLVRHAGISEPTAALIRGGELLEALIALFESYWDRATPLRIGEDGALAEGTHPCPLNSDDLYLLSLLVAGVPDKSIASQLGISQRTVQRRLSHIMELAGAQTRMQLAWHAARERWL
ncbi:MULTISPECIES: helix-turn-helix domain-containing protein [Streptosporangium]|uniref:DNA-binding NarL/FixJ family response regulator n=1 Tax=Streptosporangium brasiliense TaxID=47480 RepID=A0ABT9R7Z5_9ACTN|nr:helix-turn-helix domain-containing protein [Streptosporangium brasiliense]MDP9865366.1 DNA-binding NarL/FixJ family response regulator [Streptosporangium brasiliense]